MWKDPEPDPGGSKKEDPSKGQSSREITDLKDENEQQQLLIAQLKEMLRKEQSTVTQEKVEEYINTLSKAKAKKTKMKKNDSGSTERNLSSVSISVNKKEKINLLKQQLEENKARLAERGKSQKGIEDMVTQLKAQFNDSQQLINASSHNFTLAEPKNLEYNKNTPPEVLYNILLNKEKQITDLINMNQKQEGTILDLEENLKEKDSVIDARTKAITLMTDNLSRKGKDTLDALDDTKEQMRKMQENFVTLESEMKARQIKLLNDLKAKNFEIAELQENNEKLVQENREYIKVVNNSNQAEDDNKVQGLTETVETLKLQLDGLKGENEQHVLKIADLEKQLRESLEDLNRLKNAGFSSVSTSGTEKDDSEIAKLKKQLEESNKSMIKIKAQNKSKLKELTKKIDAFKKASDANALIVQLQGENTKLSEKIAELEEEKGNMQLKMVESTDSTKDSTQLEEFKELQERFDKNVEDLKEKDKIISVLESDIISLKKEINGLTEKILGLSDLKNVQVSSEMDSIQIEEQLENMEAENAKLRLEIENLQKTKVGLIEKVEILSRDKQELTSKLDNYIQENMDLIDKLEKLSAEKVSSAESIEIVEGLTQQEKLELAAYQKNLDVSIEGEPIKCEDDSIEPAPELNESVLQLNEDSTELLQKIDMFNMERKEVMSKMEALREENGQLNLKIKEIENNRDILAETYEQLQNEKEILQNEYEELIRKLHETNEITDETKKVETDNKTSEEFHATEKLQELQNSYSQLLSENEALKLTIKGYDTTIHEKHNLESELASTKKRIEDLETTIKANIDEINNYQTVIEDNKNELINSSDLINKLQSKLTEQEDEIRDLNVALSDLNQVVSKLQSENDKLENVEIMESQVKELKQALNDQIQQAQDYEEEISRNNNIVSDLNFKLIEMNKKIVEMEHEMEMRDIEAKKVAEELKTKEEAVSNLQKELEEKDQKISIAVGEMKEKYLGLQKQLDGNSDTLAKKVDELTNKNKEQLEKMKKIAANLKKKTQAYQELELIYNGEKEKWTTEINEKQTIISQSQDKISSIFQQLKEMEEEVKLKTSKLDDADNKTKDLLDTIQNLEQSKAELQNTIVQLKHDIKLNEVSLKQELSTSLHEGFENLQNNQVSASEDKIKELELIIETNESDLTHYKERVNKLEEDIANLGEEKEALERRSLELEEKLNLTSIDIEEKSLEEEELVQKLAKVTANDEALMKRVEEITEENRELVQKNKEFEELTQKLKIKLKKTQEKMSQLKILQSNIDELESTNAELKKQIANLEHAQKCMQVEHEAWREQNKRDYEKIETDFQVRLQELETCKNELTVECEKLQETLKDMLEREEDLLSEISEYKNKVEQNKDNDNNKIQELTEKLNAVTNELLESTRTSESLNQQIEVLQKQLLVKAAKETVDTVIDEAQEKIVMINTVGSQTEDKYNEESAQQQSVDSVPTFHWPASQEPNQDWFAPSFSDHQSQLQSHASYQSQQQITLNLQSPIIPQHSATYTQPQPDSGQPQPLAENTKEDLLRKIKALEFLLYNMDKEKEEAIEECTGMVNELSNLVYEKINTAQAGITAKPESNTISDIDAQVLSNIDVADAAAAKKDLQAIEFERTDPFLGQQTQPVVEQWAQPKDAYLTYHHEVIPSGTADLFAATSSRPEPDPFSDIDSQVLSDQDIAAASSAKKDLQAIEFEPTNASMGQQSQPVVEQLARPKRAYLTYQPEGKASGSMEAFGENDDGWGWGPEEARLEEEHLHRTEGAPPIQALREEVARLNERLQVLQVERENHLEEIKQLQVKSGKLIKKCKELKQKNDQLSMPKQDKPGDGDFFNLDATIQEELKTQIGQLEKKIKELTGELSKERLEKNNVLKRADVLTAANERMVEMKEIQDSEVLRWKRKHQEIEEKLQQYEWGSDGFNEGTRLKSLENVLPSSNSNEKIQELEKTINELSLDNEELQALLDEQRQLRINAEKAKNLPECTRTEEEFTKLSSELDTVKEQVSHFTEHLQIIEDEKNRITVENNRLETLVTEKEALVVNLQDSIKSFTDKNRELEHYLTNKDEVIRTLRESDKSCEMQQNLTDKITELEKHLGNLKEEKVQQEAHLKELEVSLNEVNTRKEQISEKLELFTQEAKVNLEDEKHKYHQLEAESTAKIEELLKELEEQKRVQSDMINLLQTESTANIEELRKELEIQKQNQSDTMDKLSELQMRQQAEVEKDDFLEIHTTQKVHHLEILLAEKESSINEIKSALDKVNGQKASLESEVSKLKSSLNEKQKEYEQLLSETDDKISQTIAELEQNWEAQVNQRGADVAESWKLHLDTVEADFSSAQEKLRFELNELEEKCNALVNENNELRKNVDIKITNEVDKISALQQQINERQQFITELNNALAEKQNEIESLNSKVLLLESEMEKLRNETSDKDSKLSSLNIVIETTRAQFDEKREVVEEIVRMLEKNTSWPLSCEKQDVLTEFQRQFDMAADKEQEIFRLKHSIEDLQRQSSSAQEKDGEIFKLNQLVEDLQNQLNVVHEKDGEISRLNKLIEDLQGQLHLLQEKESEIVGLNQIIEEFKREHDSNQQELTKLRSEGANAHLALEDYKQKLEEFKSTHIALQSSLEERNQLIATLNQQLQLTEHLKNDNNRDVEKLQVEILQIKQECKVLQQSLAECQQQLFAATGELTNKTNELESVCQQLVYSQQNYEIQESELNQLRELLQEKEREYATSVESLRQTHLRDLENHYEEVIAAKDIDIENIRSQLNESIQHSQNLSEKIAEEARRTQPMESRIKELEEKIGEQSTLLEEENKQLSEMRGIIEEQVVKIEELKKELFQKSSDYDSLIAEMDMGRKTITQQPTSSVNVAENQSVARPHPQTTDPDDLEEPVSRAELDLALYMLHQRDVRCEELTVELTQLLEERDTLQLRLSNALREREEIRTRVTGSTGSEEVAAPSSSTTMPTTPLSKSSAIFLAASGTELASEPLESTSGSDHLASKLSELRSVGYKKDKTFVDEQELRRMQQISILQQHINDASRLPPEAAAKLVDATYTLSRDVQSPSKVLLNWLWGRSTPKVNDT